MTTAGGDRCGPEAPAVAPCSRCGDMCRVSTWTYEFGRARFHSYQEIKRGVTPEEVQEGFQPLGTGSVRLCRSCFRRLWRQDLRRRLRTHLGDLASALLLGAVSVFEAPRRLPDASASTTGALAFVVLAFSSVVVARIVRSKKTALEVAFSLHRDSLAKEHGIRPELLRVRAFSLDSISEEAGGGAGRMDDS